MSCDKCALVATLTAVYQRDTLEHYGSNETDPKATPFEITPKADEDQVLSTAGKYVDKDIVVKKVPYFVISNDKGSTAYIASEVGE